MALNLLMIYALSGVFYAFGGMLEAGHYRLCNQQPRLYVRTGCGAACVVGSVSFSQ